MPPENAVVETSIRDDFEASIAAVENDDEGAITTETQTNADEEANAITSEDIFSDDGQETPEAKAEAKVEKEAGKAAEQESESKDAVDTKPGDGDIDGTADDPLVSDKAADATNLDKAPESWNPEAREGWKELSEPVKAQIAKRENEINMSLNEGAQNRKTGAAFQGIADRYAQVIAAEGAPDALTGIEELVKTVATLRMGSAQQKAQKVAGFIEHYGIDVGQLDDILTAKITGQAPAADKNDPIQRMLDERLAPVNDLLAQMNETKRATQFQANQDLINEVQTFKQDPAHEFYTDVQHDMADMVEMAQKRGVNMPLQEAYDKACALNPQISAALAQRTADERLKNGGKVLDAKRNAASSIEGKQAGAAVVDEANQSLRQTIQAGFDAQTG
jgi:hypothetical protein